MSPGIEFRAARAEDAGALADFARDSFVATFGPLYPPADLHAFLAATYGEAIQRAEIEDGDIDHQLAHAGGALIGYAKLGAERTGHARPGRPALELHRLYVAEAWKGQGVAARLMDWAIARALARGARDMTLSVFTGNVRAKRFYARYGFREVAPAVFMVGAVADTDLIYRAALDGEGL